MRAVGLLLLLLPSFVHAAPLTDSTVMNYLTKYGYINPAKISASGNVDDLRDSEDVTREGLKDLQESLGLEKTGELNKETVEEMVKPRCGLSSYQTPAALTAPGSRRRMKNLLKWKNSTITYQIKGKSKSMPKREIRAALRAAFNVWEEVTPLKFVEIPPFVSRANIVVKFVTGEHGDGSEFDGKGGTFAHAFAPPDGRLHFDDDETFVFLDYSKMTKEKPFEFVDLFYTAVHEGGHALGLDHMPNKSSIMYLTYTPTFDSNGRYIRPKLDKIDLETIQEKYGSKRKTETAGLTTSESNANESPTSTSPTTDEPATEATDRPEETTTHGGGKSRGKFETVVGKVNSWLHRFGFD